ncbi:MAG: metallophosphoesterase family protein [Thermodesulfobacteriota bacterium]|nr:metallophosphoesterase family protein [Thermodesulfobacteriota bacterium]
MKIGVISDTHLSGVNARLNEIYNNYFTNVDMIIHAGDAVSAEVIEFLGQKRLHAVQGNMDSQEIKGRLPRKKIFEANGVRIGLIHGWGSPYGIEERIKPEFEDIQVIVYGHSHRAVNHIHDGVLFFNPGTATGFCADGIHSIGILDIGRGITGNIIKI